MSNDNAPHSPHRSAPLGRRQRLQWRKRHDRNPATLDPEPDRIERGHAQAGGTRCSASQRPSLRLRPLVEPSAKVGGAIHSWAGACSAATIRNGSTYAGGSCSHDLEQAGYTFDSSRSFLYIRASGGAKHPARTRLQRGDTVGQRHTARRAGEGRAPSSRQVRALRRLEVGRRTLSLLGAVACIGLALLAVTPLASAEQRDGIRIGRLSQQLGPGRAAIEARISLRRHDIQDDGLESVAPSIRVVSGPVADAANDLPEPYPPLKADSTLARNPRPVGPGSYWYPAGPGRACIYSPQGVAPCYRLVGPGAPGGPVLDPGAIAASLADRLLLLPGRITVSPVSVGLTGAVSWFWLSPAPRTQVLSVTLAGERVTVRAEPSSVAWRFGDGVARLAGAGVPYRSGPPPVEAVVHEYETRCLAGDRGRNPYVLPACGSEGYRLEAVISWRISFVAVGPVDASGSLPSRTTATSVSYPVSEARGFLTPGVAR